MGLAKYGPFLDTPVYTPCLWAGIEKYHYANRNGIHAQAQQAETVLNPSSLPADWTKGDHARQTRFSIKAPRHTGCDPLKVGIAGLKPTGHAHRLLGGCSSAFMIGELTVFIFSCIAWPITLSLAIISLAVYSGGGNGGTGCWGSESLLTDQGIKGWSRQNGRNLTSCWPFGIGFRLTWQVSVAIIPPLSVTVSSNVNRPPFIPISGATNTGCCAVVSDSSTGAPSVMRFHYLH